MPRDIDTAGEEQHSPVRIQPIPISIRPLDERRNHDGPSISRCDAQQTARERTGPPPPPDYNCDVGRAAGDDGEWVAVESEFRYHEVQNLPGVHFNEASEGDSNECCVW